VIYTTSTHTHAGPRVLSALGLIATVVLIGACGSSAPARTTTDAAREKAVSFAQCMRSHGVGNFPDPSASGQFTLDQVANGSSVNVNTPAFTQAMSACKALEPSGFTGSRRNAGQQSAALTFAHCIRANGVSDFPDPINGQPLVDTNRIPSASSPGGMSILNAAMRKCQGDAAAAIGHRP
jgi:hypothetical protein